MTFVYLAIARDILHPDSCWRERVEIQLVGLYESHICRRLLIALDAILTPPLYVRRGISFEEIQSYDVAPLIETEFLSQKEVALLLDQARQAAGISQ
jgi:hypothetical protein